MSEATADSLDADDTTELIKTAVQTFIQHPLSRAPLGELAPVDKRRIHQDFSITISTAASHGVRSMRTSATSTHADSDIKFEFTTLRREWDSGTRFSWTETDDLDRATHLSVGVWSCRKGEESAPGGRRNLSLHHTPIRPGGLDKADHIIRVLTIWRSLGGPTYTEQLRAALQSVVRDENGVWSVNARTAHDRTGVVAPLVCEAVGWMLTHGADDADFGRTMTFRHREFSLRALRELTEACKQIMSL